MVSAVFAATILAAVPAPLERIALGSCLRQYEPAPILRQVQRDRPQLMLWLGDNIYNSTAPLKPWREEYAKLAALPGFSALRRSSMAVWDDHDAGQNDGGVDNPELPGARRAFLDFWKPDWLARPEGPGLYGAKVFGPEGRRVQVIMLDTRSFRSPLKVKAPGDATPGRYDPDTDPSKTMLGEDQWRWLAGELRRPAEVRIIASSIQVIAEDHKWEKWGNLPLEQARLFATIKEAGAAGVVFVSGDRHLGEVSMRDGGVGYPLYDLTASALNASFLNYRPHEPNRWRVGSLNVGHNYGLITIDWRQEDPLIRLQLKDASGETAVQQKAPLSWLQPGKIRPPQG